MSDSSVNNQTSNFIDTLKNNIEIVLGIALLALIIAAVVAYSRGKKAVSCPTGQSCRTPCPPARQCPTSPTSPTGTPVSPINFPSNFKPSKMITLQFRGTPLYEGGPCDFTFFLTYDAQNNKTITWPNQLHNFTFLGETSSGDIISTDSNSDLKDFLPNTITSTIDYNSCGKNWNTSSDDSRKVRIQFDKNSGKVRFFNISGDSIAFGGCNTGIQYNGPLKGTLNMSGIFSRT